MNNVSQISKAKRLNEEEVHAAAEDLLAEGIKVSSIEVYKYLGRGSLTTITNFLKTWHQEEKSTTTLPALIMLPDALKKSAEQMILKVWAESQELAEREINSQRDALRQAEVVASEKIEEAEAFSEEQAKQIEALEAHIEAIKKDRDEQHTDWIKAIEKEQEDRHQAIMEKAVCEQKLREAEKQFDYVNAALIEQQQANQTLTGENIKLKNELENAEKIRVETKIQLDKSEEKTKKLETEVHENKKFELMAGKFEAEIYNLKQNITEEKKRSDRNLKDNENLREKAARLEGELRAWKNIKPAEKKPTTSNKANHLPLKNQNKTETPTNA